MADDEEIAEKTRRENRVLDKLNSMGPQAAEKKFSEPSKAYTKKDNSKNLGKFLHPSKTVPAGEANGTVDANTGGAKVRPSQ
jgi:hypothetical protein